MSELLKEVPRAAFSVALELDMVHRQAVCGAAYCRPRRAALIWLRGALLTWRSPTIAKTSTIMATMRQAERLKTLPASQRSGCCRCNVIQQSRHQYAPASHSSAHCAHRRGFRDTHHLCIHVTVDCCCVARSMMSASRSDLSLVHFPFLSGLLCALESMESTVDCG